MTRSRFVSALFLLLLFATPVLAQEFETHRIRITNITPTQIIGPPVIASHALTTRIFRVGNAATPEVAAVAEDADSSGLVAALQANVQVLDIATGTGPIMPGQSIELEVRTSSDYPRLSAVGMLVTTNDAFFGVDGFALHGGFWRKSIAAPAYDAGSEANNESCDFIPGPPCGSPGVRATDGAEGFIHVHPGIFGIGDLSTAGYTWLNPTVRITTVRIANP